MIYRIRCFKNNEPSIFFCKADVPRNEINKLIYEAFGREGIKQIRIINDIKREIGKFNFVFA